MYLWPDKYIDFHVTKEVVAFVYFVSEAQDIVVEDYWSGRLCKYDSRRTQSTYTYIRQVFCFCATRGTLKAKLNSKLNFWKT